MRCGLAWDREVRDREVRDREVRDREVRAGEGSGRAGGRGKELLLLAGDVGCWKRERW